MLHDIFVVSASDLHGTDYKISQSACPSASTLTGDNSRNSSFIVDEAMRQIPRSAERISNSV